MALMSSAATTEESTPPERANRTFPSPICFCSAATCSLMNASASSGVVMRSMESGRTLLSMRLPRYDETRHVLFLKNTAGNYPNREDLLSHIFN